VIYILANMYLAVVPLYDIATARIGSWLWWLRKVFWFCRNINHRGDDYDFDFACNNGLIMAGPGVLYTMAQDGVFFKKAAELNHASVPAIWAQCIWASALCLTGNMVIYWILW
jgi:APA family basic amino acid/polyamine antiporter